MAPPSTASAWRRSAAGGVAGVLCAAFTAAAVAPGAAGTGGAAKPAGAATAAGPELGASPQASRKLLAHGPWPLAVARDRSNRVSGQAAAMEFGYRMFRETRMSPNGYVACISCHQTNRAFTKGIARAQGLAPVGRNTPTLTNLQLMHWYGWDGGSDSLWMASLRPMLDARELGSNAARVAKVVRIGDGLACRYRHSFGAAPAAHNDERVMVNLAKAIAAFAESMTTLRTPFDDFRDALARGDPGAAQAYPAAARRGALLFVGMGRCATCHAGPAFSDGVFHHIEAGTPAARQRAEQMAAGTATAGTADLGRESGLALWRQSPYTRAGRFSDHALQRVTADRADLSGQAQRGAFRTPPLRNVAVTAPYMHDGGVDSLFDAVRHAGSAQPAARSATHSATGGAGVPQGALMDPETADLVAFLETLTDAQAAARSFAPLRPSPCP